MPKPGLILLLLSFNAVLQAAPKAPYTPLYARHRLIAGAGDRAYRDGNFVQAGFHEPAGMALSPDGSKLYVADVSNHAVRSIDLAHQNEVTTLCGDGVKGDSDSTGGTLPARLSLPTDLAVSHDGSKLYIYDRGARKIKVWDAAQKSLSSVFKLDLPLEAGLSSLGLFLSAQEIHLAFLDPIQGSLMIGEIKSGKFIRAYQDPMLMGGGFQIALSSGRLRLMVTEKHKIYGFMANGKEVDAAGLEAVTATASLTLKEILPTQAAAVGLASMGTLDQYPGMISWDTEFNCFRLYENGHSASMGMDLTMLVPGPASVSGPARAFFKPPLNLAYDSKRGVIYISEAISNRVTAVRDESQGPLKNPLWFDHDFPRAKPVGVTRILMYGASREFHSNEEDEDIHEFMSIHLERYLNLFSALQGSGRQYEVIHDFYRGRVIGSGEIYAPEHPDLLRDYQIDLALFPMDMDSLFWNLIAWTQVETKDDVPLRSSDPEWAAKSLKEKAAHLGPGVRAFADYCKQEPKVCDGFFKLDQDGAPVFGFAGGTPATFFDREPLRRRALDIQAKVSAHLVRFCAEEKVRPVGFFVPSKDLMAGGANDVGGMAYDGAVGREMAARLTALGLPTFDLVEPTRVIEPELFPLWCKIDGHFRYSGLQWEAMIMALKIEAMMAEKKD